MSGPPVYVMSIDQAAHIYADDLVRSDVVRMQNGRFYVRTTDQTTWTDDRMCVANALLLHCFTFANIVRASNKYSLSRNVPSALKIVCAAKKLMRFDSDFRPIGKAAVLEHLEVVGVGQVYL